MASPPEETFGARLRRLRITAGLTQEALAERAGLSAQAIGALEQGIRRRPYPHTIRALANALGLPEVERDHLLTPPPKRASIPPLPATLPTRPAPPPTAALTELIGREGDLTATVAQLMEDGARCLTLTGPGGVGKTRLALRVAEMVRDHFTDGVAIVELAPLTAATLVIPTIAQALGVRESGTRPLRDEVQAVLRAQSLLLVLDNCEHVLDAAPDIAALLSACPTLVVLATSRAPLRLRGERERAVAPLAIPTPDDLPTSESVARTPAVQLFVERARAVAPSFALSDSSAAAVATICRRLDGLPLALELAAGWVRLLPPTALVARLDARLPLLTSGPRDLPERQRTMRDTIAWSHALLDTDEQRLFRRLAIFAGGWTLDAATHVCGDGDDGPILEGLASLLEKSLLTSTAGADGVAPRHGMLETIREYGLEQLAASEELAMLQDRHAAYYRALASEASALLTGPDQLAALARLAPESHNLRATARTLLDRGAAEAAVDLVWTLQFYYWWLRGQQQEGRRWAEAALTGQHGVLSPLHRARAFLTIGMSWSGSADQIARAALEEGLDLARHEGDAQGEAIGLMMLGLLAADAGDTALAQSTSEESLRLFRALGADWGTAFALVNLGVLPLLRGDHDAALRLFAASLATARRSGDRVATHRAHYYLGLLARVQDNDSGAADHFAAGLVLAGELRDRVNTGYFVQQLATLAIARGQLTEAARLLGAAERLLEATGAPLHRDVPGADWHERAIETARTTLGPHAFEQARIAGRTLTLAEAVAAALASNTARPPCASRP